MQSLIVYPCFQVAGQEEIDRVVGRDRLPTLDDLPKLPYVCAFVHEVMRLYPATPFAIPHSMSEVMSWSLGTNSAVIYDMLSMTGIKVISYQRAVQLLLTYGRLFKTI